MSMRCDECQHWVSWQGRVEGDWVDEDSVGNTAHYGRCKILGSSDGEPLEKNPLAFAKDYESYHATVFTKPEFGCKLFLKVIL
jgi:pyruvate-formate lyase-activating enzyme